MIRDAAFAFIFFFMFAIALLIIYLVGDGLNDAIQGSEHFGAAEKSLHQDYTDKFSNVWDYTFLTIVLGVFLAILGLSWILRSNPVVFFALLIIVVVLGAVAGYLANAWIDVTAGTTLSAVVAEFPIMDFIMSNYLIVVLVEAFLMLVIFFAKPGGEVGY